MSIITELNQNVKTRKFAGFLGAIMHYFYKKKPESDFAAVQWKTTENTIRCWNIAALSQKI